MALPILKNWQTYFDIRNEGLGSSYERVIINKLLLRMKKEYRIQSVVEVPIFGFTGITGINSVALHLEGCKVTLVDHDQDRMDKVMRIHKFMNLEMKTVIANSYNQLPFKDKSFDMAWNFSALWFVDELDTFLAELSRITNKVILLCVPNQSGFGYKWQKAHSDIPQDICFHEEYINPGFIKHTMRKLKWNFVGEDFIDCPPWPDIGMSKEKFIAKIIGSNALKESSAKPVKPISIVDYYSGIDSGFPARMEKFGFLEKNAPNIFKKYWSHHTWLLFTK